MFTITEQYKLKRSNETYTTSILIRLENLEKHTDDEQLKPNILKYIEFSSAKRLSPGIYTTYERTYEGGETLEITNDDIKIALTNALERERNKHDVEAAELLKRHSDCIERFKNIQESYNACIAEIDENIKNIPSKEAKKSNIKDEIAILNQLIIDKKYELDSLE